MKDSEGSGHLLFPFTRRKLLGMSVFTRHKWIIHWLTRFYQQLRTNRVSEVSCTCFYQEYTRVCGWISFPVPDPPARPDTRSWLVMVSDAVQAHRMAMGQSPRDGDLLPPAVSNDRSQKKEARAGHDYHLALDGLRSMFNTGALFRTCDAAGFKGLVLGNMPGGDHPALQKTAMGTSKWIHHEATDDLAGYLVREREKGIPVMGVETADNAVSYTDFDWPRQGILVLGNEEYGLSPQVMQACGTLIRIPMLGRKNSLNVAIAGGVIMFHVAARFMPSSPQAL